MYAKMLADSSSSCESDSSRSQPGANISKKRWRKAKEKLGKAAFSEEKKKLQAMKERVRKERNRAKGAGWGIQV